MKYLCWNKTFDKVIFVKNLCKSTTWSAWLWMLRLTVWVISSAAKQQERRFLRIQFLMCSVHQLSLENRTHSGNFENKSNFCCWKKSEWRSSNDLAGWALWGVRLWVSDGRVTLQWLLPFRNLPLWGGHTHVQPINVLFLGLRFALMIPNKTSTGTATGSARSFKTWKNIFWLCHSWQTLCRWLFHPLT